jgi:hypothetical protein
MSDRDTDAMMDSFARQGAAQRAAAGLPAAHSTVTQDFCEPTLADRAADAACQLHRQLIWHNRTQPHRPADAPEQIRVNSSEPWRLPDAAIKVRPVPHQGDFILAVSIHPDWVACVAWLAPQPFFAGYQVEVRPWRGEAA